GPSPEGVLGDEQWVSDSYLKTASRTGCPNAAMLGAERAVARAGRYLLRFGFPRQGKRDIFAMTAAENQHGTLLNDNRLPGSDMSTHLEEWLAFCRVDGRCGDFLPRRRISSIFYRGWV